MFTNICVNRLKNNGPRKADKYRLWVKIKKKGNCQKQSSTKINFQFGFSK